MTKGMMEQCSGIVVDKAFITTYSTVIAFPRVGQFCTSIVIGYTLYRFATIAKLTAFVSYSRQFHFFSLVK